MQTSNKLSTAHGSGVKMSVREQIEKWWETEKAHGNYVGIDYPKEKFKRMAINEALNTEPVFKFTFYTKIPENPYKSWDGGDYANLIRIYVYQMFNYALLPSSKTIPLFKVVEIRHYDSAFEEDEDTKLITDDLKELNEYISRWGYTVPNITLF
ncbi:MAG: hypothetical protein ACTSRR_09695 [Candidatus Heimdallarchaeaceae archaeon]